MEDSWLILLEVVKGIVPPVAVYLLVYYAQKVQVWRQRKREFKENLREGAIEEPHATRDLTGSERKLMDKLYLSHQFAKNLPEYFFLFTLFFLTSTLFWLAVALDNSFSERDLIMSLIAGVVTAYLLIRLLKHGTVGKSGQYYKDLRVPVWHVQGAYTPLHVGNPYRATQFSAFSVRNHRFVVQGESDGMLNFHIWEVTEKLKELSEGTEVCVEYSPFSHFVWKIAECKDAT